MGHASAPDEAPSPVEPDDGERVTAGDSEPELAPAAADAEPESPLPEVELDDPYGMLPPRECPLCAGAGHIPYGMLQSARYETCDECGGIGLVRTGSLVSESSVQPCEKCNGSGYTPTQAAQAAPLAAVPSVPPPGEPPWPGAVWDTLTAAWTTQAQSA